MKQFPNVVQEGRIGAWCHAGAWMVAVIGALEVLILVTQNQVLPILGVLGGTIFSFLILYAVGTLVTHTLGQRLSPSSSAGGAQATAPGGQQQGQQP